MADVVLLLALKKTAVIRYSVIPAAEAASSVERRMPELLSLS